MANKYIPAIKVFSCCGQYIAVSKDVKGTITCPRCGAKHTAPLQNPKIVIVTNK